MERLRRVHSPMKRPPRCRVLTRLPSRRVRALSMSATRRSMRLRMRAQPQWYPSPRNKWRLARQRRSRRQQSRRERLSCRRRHLRLSVFRMTVSCSKCSSSLSPATRTRRSRRSRSRRTHRRQQRRRRASGKQASKAQRPCRRVPIQQRTPKSHSRTMNSRRRRIRRRRRRRTSRRSTRRSTRMTARHHRPRASVAGRVTVSPRVRNSRTARWAHWIATERDCAMRPAKPTAQTSRPTTPVRSASRMRPKTARCVWTACSRADIATASSAWRSSWRAF
mmetsp:Transcript_19473/g.49512  ORF Transcript_19473/g.49512 Transcript_19473/m.49512 type:complete len:278 (-) Transcript_19473:795-1628(-)